jgi:hypothetical protein
MALTKLNNQSLTAVTSTGLPSGTVLQVVSVSANTSLSTSSTSFVDIPDMTATITPQNSSNKILICYVNHIYINGTSNTSNWQVACINLYRGSTLIREEPTNQYHTGHVPDSTTHRFMDFQTIFYYDSPATTSATTYKLQGAAVGEVIFNHPNYGRGGTITLMEIAG